MRNYALVVILMLVCLGMGGFLGYIVALRPAPLVLEADITPPLERAGMLIRPRETCLRVEDENGDILTVKRNGEILVEGREVACEPEAAKRLWRVTSIPFETKPDVKEEAGK